MPVSRPDSASFRPQTDKAKPVASTPPPRDMLYSMARAILFRMDPERAHDLALATLDRMPLRNWLTRRYRDPSTPVDSLGMRFANHVGLAAGLDKNGDYIDALGALGFGFLEVGTVTPKPQAGNDKPRMFRLVENDALINRMGFNNKGVDHLVAQVERVRYTGKLGINIGKNAATPIEKAADDYQYCLERVYAHADYVTVNISSPNTVGLRDLQHGDKLRTLLHRLKSMQSRLATSHQRHVPVLVKIAPDMNDAEIDDFAEAVIEHDIEGVISGNTSRERTAVQGHRHADQTGGLSGSPIRTLADEKLHAIRERLPPSNVTLIGVGGIASGEDARHKLDLGASLVQLYTGFIYHGPALVADCVKATRFHETT